MAFLGIDLGNYRTLASIIKPQSTRPVELLNDCKSNSTRSAVSFSNGKLAVGKTAAKNALKTNSLHNVVLSLQRCLGANQHVIDSEQQWLSADIQFRNGVAHATVENILASQSKTPKSTIDESIELVVAVLLHKLIENAVAVAGPLHSIVLSAPCYYSQEQCTALKVAASIAVQQITKLEQPQVHIMDAQFASIAYHAADRKEEFHERFRGIQTWVAFVDMGHASTSVYIASFDKDKAVLRAVQSDENLGSRNIDKILYDKAHVLLRSRRAKELNQRQKALLMDCCEKAKHEMSLVESYEMEIGNIVPDIPSTVSLTQLELEKDCANLIQTLRRMCKKVKKAAGMRCDDKYQPEKVTSVEMIGSGTIFPMFRNVVKNVFEVDPRIPLSHGLSKGCAQLAFCMGSTTHDASEIVAADWVTGGISSRNEGAHTPSKGTESFKHVTGEGVQHTNIEDNIESPMDIDAMYYMYPMYYEERSKSKGEDRIQNNDWNEGMKGNEPAHESINEAIIQKAKVRLSELVNYDANRLKYEETKYSYEKEVNLMLRAMIERENLKVGCSYCELEWNNARKGLNDMLKSIRDSRYGEEESVRLPRRVENCREFTKKASHIFKESPNTMETNNSAVSVNESTHHDDIAWAVKCPHTLQRNFDKVKCSALEELRNFMLDMVEKPKMAEGCLVYAWNECCEYLSETEKYISGLMFSTDNEKQLMKSIQGVREYVKDKNGLFKTGVGRKESSIWLPRTGSARSSNGNLRCPRCGVSIRKENTYCLRTASCRKGRPVHGPTQTG